MSKPGQLESAVLSDQGSLIHCWCSIIMVREMGEQTFASFSAVLLMSEACLCIIQCYVPGTMKWDSYVSYIVCVQFVSCISVFFLLVESVFLTLLCLTPDLTYDFGIQLWCLRNIGMHFGASIPGQPPLPLFNYKFNILSFGGGEVMELCKKDSL